MDFFVDHQYLVLPVNQNAKLKKILFYDQEKQVYELDAHIDIYHPQHNYYIDMSHLHGLMLRVSIEPDMDMTFSKADTIPDDLSLYANGKDPDLLGIYREPYRPKTHFTARMGWLNDPNGLYFLNGQYHLFFQYNPAGAIWGNMHWGHAVSEDLTHWKELRPALFPDETGTMFSGCAYVDHKNASGLGENGKPPVLLYYTAAGNTSRLSAERDFTQCLAYSVDNGDSFRKYERNPLIPQAVDGNRDPKVVFCPELDQYLMALYLNKSDYMLLSSDNLIDWQEMQRFELEGDDECPDFYRLQVANEPGVYKWVFSGASDYYLIGSVSKAKKAFIPEQSVQRYYHGKKESYAAQTFNNTSERMIRITWQSVHCPDSPFECQMSLPCELSLVKIDQLYYLKSEPVIEIEQLRMRHQSWLKAGSETDKLCLAASLVPQAYELMIRTQNKNQMFQISLFGVNLHVDAEKNQITLNNEQIPLSMSSNPIDIRLIIDTCGVELFADQGLIHAVQLHISDYNLNKLMLTGGQQAYIDEIHLYPLKNIWTDAEVNK